MNAARVPRSPPLMTVKMRSVDGGVYWIVSRNPVDYILHPAFLKFVVTACLIYALLDGGTEAPDLQGWAYLAAWAQTFITILLWLCICGGVIRLMFRRALIQQVWTPSILLPMLLLIELLNQTSLNHFIGLPFKPLGVLLVDVTRDMVFVLLFDYIHGQYVVARHPQARLADPAGDDLGEGGDPTSDESVATKPVPPVSGGSRLPLTPEPTAAPHKDPDDAPQDILTAPQRRSGSARIGTETFVLSDILMIRIEDHYLGITTRAGRSLQRAKLAAIEGLHDGDLGIQINRSVWVAFSAIREAQRMKNGQILLVLVNGDEELVAKPRVYAFRQAYKRTQPDGVDPFA